MTKIAVAALIPVKHMLHSLMQVNLTVFVSISQVLYLSLPTSQLPDMVTPAA